MDETQETEKTKKSPNCPSSEKFSLFPYICNLKRLPSCYGRGKNLRVATLGNNYPDNGHKGLFPLGRYMR